MMSEEEINFDTYQKIEYRLSIQRFLQEEKEQFLG